MANLHIEWEYPGTGAYLIRSSIPDTATDEILEKVLRSEREYVTREYGPEVGQTVRWRNNQNWKARQKRLGLATK